MIVYPETLTLSDDDLAQRKGNITVVQRDKVANTIKDWFPNLQLILDWYGSKPDRSEKSMNTTQYQGIIDV